MTDRTRLKLGLLVVVYVFVGWVLSGFPLMEPISVALSVLELSGVAMLTLYLVCSRAPIFARSFAFATGLAWLMFLEARYFPAPYFDRWYVLHDWLPFLVAAGTVIGIGLFRPRFALRYRRDSASLLRISASVVFRQLRLWHASLLSDESAAPPQFALRHIFYLCTVVAVLLVARGPLMEHLLIPFMDYVTPGLVGLAAIRASLAPRKAVLKCAAAFVFATLLGESVYWLVFRQHHSGMSEVSLVIMASLLVVRSCGYRLAGSERLVRVAG